MCKTMRTISYFLTHSFGSFVLEKISLVHTMAADPLQKIGGGHGQNMKQIANLGNSYCSYKNLRQANAVVGQYLNTYKIFTANTDWNMTHNQTESSHM